METEELRERLAQAELVLVGLGEEFDAVCGIKGIPEFQRGRELLRDQGVQWLLPAWGEHCACKSDVDVRSALEKIKDLLEGKNYFVVSVSVHSDVASVFGESGRLVMPCGSVRWKQCEKACEGEICPVDEKDIALLEKMFRRLWTGGLDSEEVRGFGNCRKCGSPMVLNNVYTAKYDESGYLGDWQRYTKWLQGTLNHRLLLLELGVSMGFPSVVRIPFEKIASYNQKAFLWRVNEKLCQLPSDLSTKGIGISKNAIDWISQL